jgi:hypothetical protein
MPGDKQVPESICKGEQACAVPAPAISRAGATAAAAATANAAMSRFVLVVCVVFMMCFLFSNRGPARAARTGMSSDPPAPPEPLHTGSGHWRPAVR